MTEENREENKVDQTKSEPIENDGHDSSSTSCGCGPCAPSWARRFANPIVFVVHASIIYALNTMTNTYLGGVLSSIERAFQISSSYAGLVVVVDDFVSLSLVFIVSYFGHTSHRPRIVALGATLYGIGAIFMAIPHYITEPLDPVSVIFGNDQFSSTNSDAHGLCTASNGNHSDSTLCDDGSYNERVVSIVWLMIGRVICGAGAGCQIPLMLSYLDDGVGRHQLTTYTTFMFITVGLGAPLGYFLSSQTTSMYVDFDRIPAESIPDIPLNDPRWIGSWWIGFLALGFVWILVSLPMYLYPKQLPRSTSQSSKGNNIEEKSKKEDGHISANTLKQFLHHAVGILKALKRLLTNVPLVFTCLGLCADQASIITMGNFLVKTLEVQFVISSSLASTLFGGTILMATILSQIISGYICRKFKLESYGCALFILVCNVCAALLMFSLIFVGCSTSQIIGVNVPYSDQLSTAPKISNEVLTDSTCNADCSCPLDIFRPVCGSDGLTYISPCHAGCTSSFANSFNESSENNFLSETNITYHDCHCILSNDSISTDTIPSGAATSGQCIGDCDTNKLITIFLALMFFGIAFGTMVANPNIYVLMRVVDENDRSIALAFKQVVATTLGSLPAPIYFGAIINSTCILWQRSCGESGSCWLYDTTSYRVGFFGTLFAMRVFIVLCTSVVAVASKREKRRLVKNALSLDEIPDASSKNTVI